MNRKTKELALCGVMAALGVALLCFGGVVPFATYAAPVLASLTLLPVREDCRMRYAWCCFAAAALLGLLLSPDKEAALLYCFLGYYPLIKGRLDAVRSGGLRVAAKLLLFTIATGAMYALAIFVLQLASVVEELQTQAPWMLWTTVALGIVLFFVYDVLLGRFSVLYRRRRK